MTQDRHGNWYVQDAGSTTGTHVNDADPEPTQVLKSGDVISFGMVDTVFHLPASAYALVRRLV
jgi:pSer/pThr/pTyr-binding forkhead associated (FHA) protein